MKCSLLPFLLFLPPLARCDTGAAAQRGQITTVSRFREAALNLSLICHDITTSVVITLSNYAEWQIQTGWD